MNDNPENEFKKNNEMGPGRIAIGLYIVKRLAYIILGPFKFTHN